MQALSIITLQQKNRHEKFIIVAKKEKIKWSPSIVREIWLKYFDRINSIVKNIEKKANAWKSKKLNRILTENQGIANLFFIQIVACGLS